MTQQKLAQTIKQLATRIATGETPAATKKVAAEKVVKFTGADGKSFFVLLADVGTDRWAYSPFDRSRAERVGVINMSLSGAEEEFLGYSG